jgi:hypothetical protein
MHEIHTRGKKNETKQTQRPRTTRLNALRCTKTQSYGSQLPLVLPMRFVRISDHLSASPTITVIFGIARQARCRTESAKLQKYEIMNFIQGKQKGRKENKRREKRSKETDAASHNYSLECFEVHKNVVVWKDRYHWYYQSGVRITPSDCQLESNLKRVGEKTCAVESLAICFDA